MVYKSDLRTLGRWCISMSQPVQAKSDKKQKNGIPILEPLYMLEHDCHNAIIVLNKQQEDVYSLST